jgi:membrane protease YdiL (CAAX protease family)
MSKNAKKELLFICIIQFGLLIILTLTQHLSNIRWLVTDIGFALVLIYQIYLPATINQKQNYKPIITFKGFDKEKYKDLFLVSLITLPLYILIYYFIQTHIYKLNPVKQEIGLSLFIHFIYSFLINFFLIALPEEYYYRGFLQRRLLNIYHAPTAITLTAIFFALGHFVGNYNVVRLATFFPSLLFSFLAYKTDSIFPAVLYHTLCNVIAEAMYIIYHGI